MFRKNLAILSAVLLASTFIFAQETSDSGPHMVVPEKIMDIGEVAQGVIADVNFKIINEGDETLEIKAVRPTCGCTVAKFDREIAAGKTGWIKTKLDTRDFAGPISKSILVMTSDPQTSAITLIIKADVHPYVEVLPRPLLRFNTLQKEGASEKVTIIALDGASDFKVLKAESSSSFLTAEIRKLESDELLKGHPEIQYEVKVTVSDDAPVGPVQGELTIHTNHKMAKKVSVKIFGVIRSVLQISPAQVQFGPVQASAGPGRHIIVVNNRPATPVKLTNVTIDDSAFDAKIVEVSEGKRYQVTVKINKDAEKGSHDAKLVLTTDDKEFPTLTVPVRASIR